MRPIRPFTTVLSLAALTALAATSWVGPCADAAEPGPGETGPALAVDDFEDRDLGAPRGHGWFAIADEQIGGGSRARLEPIAGGADGSRGALRVSGRVAAREGGGFAGAWTMLAPEGGTADLSGRAAIRFRARGDGGGYSVQVRCADGARAANFSAPFTAGREWTRFEIPLAALEQAFPPAPPYEWTGRDAVALGFVAGGTAGEFELAVDEVEIVSAAPAAGPAAEAPASAPAEGRTAGAEAPEAVRGSDRPSAPASGPSSKQSSPPLAAPPPVAVVELAPPAAAGIDGWLTLGAEPEADGRLAGLPDLRDLSVRYDPGERRVWFRLGLHAEPPADWFGLNLALETDGDPANGSPWWNVNKEFRFDRLVTVWLSRTGAVYQGAAGVADAEAVARFAMDGVTSDLRVVRDPEGRALAVGVPLAALGGGRLDLVATVGSSFAANDDLPDKGSIRLDLGRLVQGKESRP